MFFCLTSVRGLPQNPVVGNMFWVPSFFGGGGGLFLMSGARGLVPVDEGPEGSQGGKKN